KVALTTNGTLLKKRGDELLLTKPYKINISLHSFEGEDDVARRAYIDSCLDFAKRASDEGILVVLRLWNLSDDGILDGSIEALNGKVLDSIREKFGEYESVSARGARIKDKLHIEFGKRFDWPDNAAEDGGDQVFCHGLGDHFGILSDGTVVPCCLDAEGDIALGNIFEEDVRSILKGERATRMAEGFTKKTACEDLCRRCGYARRFKI
ncbi:MAG: SPASM domain-containing protein, partial [Clostridia bacterium]|nr:SPASM domain-containing protein [Clostridia bacterium]